MTPNTPKRLSIIDPVTPIHTTTYTSSISTKSSTTNSTSPTIHNTPNHETFNGIDVEKPEIDERSIKVVARIKPDINNIIESNDTQVSINTGKETIDFTFDRVFPGETTQQEIYNYLIQETIDDIFKGYNGTILAYGQTGSGKSYTMLGPDLTSDERGLVPRIADEIFKRIKQGNNNIEYMVNLSIMEIYLDQINDLLVTNPRLVIHEDKEGIYVKGLSSMSISSAQELYKVIKLGLKHRTSSGTNMNLESSRSHAIFELKIQQKDEDSMKISRLFLIDLAGSEKVDRTGAFGQTLKEAQNINSSLSTLGNVINALNDKSPHIPYRDSKLTRILQESLGGNSRTTLILNISPNKLNELESLSTLRFGSRAKNIKNHAHVNKELTIGEMKFRINQLTRVNQQNKLYIEKLESQLRSVGGNNIIQQVSINTAANGGNGGKVSPHSSKGNKRYSTSSPIFESKIPLPSSPLSPKLDLREKLNQKETRIKQLEDELLNYKIKNLEISNDEEIKLNILEKSLNKLSQKLNDVEIININLRKHLMINERLIDQKQETINHLNKVINDLKNLTTVSFDNRLNSIRDKLEPLSPRSGLNLKIIRPIIGGGDEGDDDDESEYDNTFD